jgi:very-short-patch-repair endonuclease
MICKECNQEFKILDSLRRHRVQKHKINAEQTYIDYVLNGVKPKCKCGCGDMTKFLGIDLGFRDYKRGHSSRINNNWGHNPDVIKKSHETQKKLYSEGKLKIWNKGLTVDDVRVRDNIEKIMSNPKRGINISKALSGVPKTSEHIENIKKSSKLRWQNYEEREKQSKRLIDNLIKNNYRNKKTKLEILFQAILNELGLIENIDYKYQHQVSSAIFDFYIFNKNILIEIDGDFHHCNPNSIHSIPSFPIQIKTVGNDIRKNRIAETSHIKLLRFWETDIKNNKNNIVKSLKYELQL